MRTRLDKILFRLKYNIQVESNLAYIFGPLVDESIFYQSKERTVT